VRPDDRDAIAIVKEYEQFQRQVSGGGRLQPVATSKFPEIITIAPRPG